jgi:hypothetical protein
MPRLMRQKSTNVADEVEAGGVVAAQEIEKGFGLAGLGAQMQVRDENCAVTPHPGLRLHVVFVPCFQYDAPGLKVILFQACDIGMRWLTAGRWVTTS